MRRLLTFAFVLLLPVVAHASGAITLTATTDSIELVTSSANSLDYRCSWVDNTSTTFTPGSSQGNIAAATDTTVVAAPGASTQRKISGCTFYAAGGSNTITVQFDTSGTERLMYIAVLSATGWSLHWNEENSFEVRDDTGKVVARTQIWDGTDTALVSAGGALLTDASATTQPISAASLPLPTGAATAANQDGIVKDGAGDTTQANVSGGRLHVDGSGVTQPVSGTVTATATDLDIRNLNATDDLVQARGAAADGAAVAGNPVLIAGQDGTNAQSIKTDTTGSVQVDVETLPALVAGTANIGDVDVLTLPALVAGTANIGDVDVLTLPSVTIGTFPDNEPFNQAQRGGVAVVAGACERESLLYIQINQTTGTQLITGTASERIYICSIQLMTATAQNIALVDGTGSVCATSPTGLLGGSTAATGWNFAANGGIVLPPSRDSYTKTSTDADNVCLLQSGAGQVSGSLTYISIPNI